MSPGPLKSDDLVGVALVGPGMIAEYHLSGLAATERSSLKAVVGRQLAKADALKTRFAGEIATTNLDEVLQRDDVDALIVTTPDDTHEAIACAALAADKAVLLQKPMAQSLAAAERIARVAGDRAVDLQVSFMHRYFEEVRAARSLVDSGAIGRVTSARMRNATPGPDWSDWFFDARRVGTGAVAQLGIHGIDLLMHLFGPILGVSARLAIQVPTRLLADGREVTVHNPDTAVASYDFANGLVASHEMSMIEAAGCDRFRLEIYGTQGTIWLRSERGLLALSSGGDAWTIPDLPTPVFGRVQHDRWLNGLTGVDTPESTVADALSGMAVLEAIEQSARDNSVRVEIPGG